MNSQMSIAEALLARTPKGALTADVNSAQVLIGSKKYQDLPPVVELKHEEPKEPIAKSNQAVSQLLDRPKGSNVLTFMGPPGATIWTPNGKTSRRFNEMGLYETSDPIEIHQLRETFGVTELRS